MAFDIDEARDLFGRWTAGAGVKKDLSSLPPVTGKKVRDALQKAADHAAAGNHEDAAASLQTAEDNIKGKGLPNLRTAIRSARSGQVSSQKPGGKSALSENAKKAEDAFRSMTAQRGKKFAGSPGVKGGKVTPADAETMKAFRGVVSKQVPESKMNPAQQRAAALAGEYAKDHPDDVMALEQIAHQSHLFTHEEISHLHEELDQFEHLERDVKTRKKFFIHIGAIITAMVGAALLLRIRCEPGYRRCGCPRSQPIPGNSRLEEEALIWPVMNGVTDGFPSRRRPPKRSSTATSRRSGVLRRGITPITSRGMRSR